MKKHRVMALFAVFALVLAACTGDVASTTTEGDDTPTTAAETTTTAGGEETTTTGGEGEDNPLAEFGESIDADPALIEKALGPVDPSDEESWNIILASIARANQDLDQATIDKAMECWSEPQCDTGSGGDLVMGYADGGGHINVWRAVSHMEAILQALSYPEIGTIISREALFQLDPAVADIQFMVQSDVDFIVSYPDWGAALADTVSAATEAGVPFITFSAGYVGLPTQDGALVPGDDYLGVVGEDLCALGESFADVLNDGVGDGKVGVLGGSPGNALSLGWQQCHLDALADSVEVVNPPPDQNTTTGDTNWLNDQAISVVQGLLSLDNDITGFSYEYADGMNSALVAWDNLNLELDEMTLALRTDEQTLFCDWVERDLPNYTIWYSAGGNFQSRTAVTAAMLHLQGYEIPGEITVPHVMRQVSADDCNADRATPAVSGTSLVPDNVLTLMFGGG